MLQNRLAFPLTAATLAGLLAACGDPGTGNTDASHATPKDVPTSVAEKAPAASGPLIDASGVRGDLLLSMMDHRSCHHAYPQAAASQDGPRIAAGPPDVDMLSVKTGMQPTNYRQRPDARWPVGPVPGFDPMCSQGIYMYAPFAGGNATLEQQTGAYSFRGTPDLRALRPVPWAKTSTPISFSGDTVTLGTNQTIERQNAEKLTLISANAYSFRIGDRVPYGVLSQWGQGQRFTELQLLPVDNAKRARLCWNVHVGAVRRLHCTVWEVPEGWQRGSSTLSLQDQYVRDDRVVHAGESGYRHFRSNF